jgi:hypothetical protein
MTTREKKSSATARVRRKSRTAGFTRLPKILKAPIASATSVGIETAQAREPGTKRVKIRAGRSIPPRAEIAGRIASLGRCSPSLISRPINTKKMKVKISESTVKEYRRK